MFEYQQTGRYFAQIAGGMEEMGAAEAQELGSGAVELRHRGFFFSASPEALYRIHYRSRLISRILTPLKSFPCFHSDELYAAAGEIQWEKLLSNDKTFAVGCNVANSRITHSHFAALRVKDAIADRLKRLTGARPSVNVRNPQIRLHLHIENNQATVSLDTSGGPLHKRAYRVRSVSSPLQETLAAAIIRLSGWEGQQPLYDPMCGSGTLLAEALMHYCRIPSGLLRRNYGLSYLPDFDPRLWERVVKDAHGAMRPLPAALLAGSDIDKTAVAATRANLRRLPGGESIRIKRVDFRTLPPFGNTTIICNPPYGVRMGDEEQSAGLLKQLGDFLKQKCAGSTAFIYVGSARLVGAVGLKPAFRIPLVNGALEGRLARFDLY